MSFCGFAEGAPPREMHNTTSYYSTRGGFAQLFIGANPCGAGENCAGGCAGYTREGDGRRGGLRGLCEGLCGRCAGLCGLCGRYAGLFGLYAGKELRVRASLRLSANPPSGFASLPDYFFGIASRLGNVRAAALKPAKGHRPLTLPRFALLEVTLLENRNTPPETAPATR